MQSIHEAIPVRLDASGRPCAWRWRGQVWRRRHILDRWVLQTRWWTGAHERRDYLLVEAESGAGHPCAVEIYRRRVIGGSERATDAWVLARLLA